MSTALDYYIAPSGSCSPPGHSLTHQEGSAGSSKPPAPTTWTTTFPRSASCRAYRNHSGQQLTRSSAENSFILHSADTGPTYLIAPIEVLQRQGCGQGLGEALGQDSQHGGVE
jgi:hypothetical protein